MGLDQFWGPRALALADSIAAADSPGEALIRLQLFFAARHQQADPFVAELVRRLMPWRPTEISTLADHLALSESQLRRRCLTAVGVGPKALQRTLRFQGYLALAQAGFGDGLADLAAQTGYADHAHLSRECLRLTGVTPRDLLGDKADRPTSPTLTSTTGPRRTTVPTTHVWPPSNITTTPTGCFTSRSLSDHRS